MKKKPRAPKETMTITISEFEKLQTEKKLAAKFKKDFDLAVAELEKVKTSRDNLQRRVAALSRGNNLTVAKNERLESLNKALEKDCTTFKEARDYQSKRADDADKVAEMYGKESIELRATLHRIAFPAKKLAEFVDWFRKLSLFKRLKFAIDPNDYSILDCATSGAETIFALTNQQEI